MTTSGASLQTADHTFCKWVARGDRVEYRTREGEPIIVVTGKNTKDAIRRARALFDALVEEPPRTPPC